MEEHEEEEEGVEGGRTNKGLMLLGPSSGLTRIVGVAVVVDVVAIVGFVGEGGGVGGVPGVGGDGGGDRDSRRTDWNQKS